MNTSTLKRSAQPSQVSPQERQQQQQQLLTVPETKFTNSVLSSTLKPQPSASNLQLSRGASQKSNLRQTTGVSTKPGATVSMQSIRLQTANASQIGGSIQKSIKKSQYSSDSESESESDEDQSAVNESTISQESEMNDFNCRQNRILNFLVVLCEAELLLEKLRQKVCGFTDFQPYSVFQRFNRKSKKEIQSDDIEQFLKTVDAKANPIALHSFLTFFDVDRSKSLSFVEFQAALITTEDQMLSTKVTSRAVYKVNSEQYLSLQLEVNLGKLFTQYMDYCLKNEEYRKLQEDNFNFDEFMAAFKFLDKDGDGEIEESDLIDYIASQGYTPSDTLAWRIIRSFKGPNADQIEQDSDYIIGYDANGNPIYKKSIDKMKFVRFNVTKDMDKQAILRQFEFHAVNNVKVPVRKLRSLEIRREWMEIFKERVEPEKEIEYCKQDLVMQKDFSALDMFTLINSDQNEYISVEEFVESMQELGVKPTKEEIYLLFRRHAKNKIKGLRKREFKRAILPNQHMYDKVAKGRVKVSKDGIRIRMRDILEPETLRRFKRLMIALLKFELKIEGISVKLANLKTFSYQEFFELLDPNGKGYFSYQDLKDVFVEHGVNITEKDLSFLFERLDCKEKDQMISYSEFISEVHPHLERNLTGKIFTEAQRFKQAQSMANLIDSHLNLQSRHETNTGNTHKNNTFSIPSLQRIGTDV